MLDSFLSTTATLSEQDALLAALTAMAPAGIHVGCRRIQPGDQALLLPGEQTLITSQVPAVRNASGAARHVARQLLHAPGTAIGRTRFGAPAWPLGIVGSLAHDEQWAVAAVASTLVTRALGIDVEPALPLPQDLHGFVVGPQDVFDAGDELAGRLIFSAKEAVYKAVHPLDEQILEFADISVDLLNRRAVTRTGHVLDLYISRTPRITVLAAMTATGATRIS
jgi:4'-phosphopantetheinyl transferase EntD